MGMDIKSGYIILRHTLGFYPIAWGIRKLTGSFWNHTGGVVEDGDGSLWVIEADPPVVKKTPLAEYINPKKYIIKIVALKPEAFKNISEYRDAQESSDDFLRSKVGSRYDKRAIIWLALSYTILPILRKFKKNGFQNRLEFFCSEIVCQAWHRTSSIIINLFAGLKRPEAKCDTTTPGDISKAFSTKYIAGKDVK